MLYSINIIIPEGNNISVKKLKSFEAVKTTLTGDYSHNHKALDKTLEYFKANHLSPDSAFSHLEIYTIGKNEIKSPSKWVTEIYYPIKPKIVITPTVIIPQTTEEIVPNTKIEKEIPSEF